jgi:two-component system, OmpR family, KDP operon response regulator KdpE
VIFRRTQTDMYAVTDQRFNVGDLEIDYGRHMVFVRGTEVNLTDTEYKILSFLAMNAGRIIAPEYILEKVWGSNCLNKHHMLWVNMCRLRNKLDQVYAGSKYIQTRPGLGYLMSLN